MILLNCLPPTDINKPAIALEVLKSYVESKETIDVDIIYWNLIIHDFLKQYGFNEKKISESEINMLGFYYILAEEFNDMDKQEELLIHIQEEFPANKILEDNYYNTFFQKFTKALIEKINEKLKEILTDDLKVFGISAKYDGWIAGYILAKLAKKIKPDIKIVIGGFENIDNAKAIFQKFNVFDIAVFGEGEESLLKIHQYYNNKIEISEIPQIIYYKNENLVINESNASNNDVNNSFPLNIDYFNQCENIIPQKDITISIEGSRGCRWNKCNFCALNWGNEYTTKKLSAIISEIKYNYQKHNIKKYFFTDNDIVGKKSNIFNDFLDELINLSEEFNTDFEFHADILHKSFTKTIIKKMSLAGFKSVQIGYEAVTDNMLKKLNKATTFADNLLFLKFAFEYDISSFATGLIIGITKETKADILESMNNLHYLRFFLDGNQSSKYNFTHQFAELVMFYNTGFWRMLSNKQREEFRNNPTEEMLPNMFFNGDERYSVFGLQKKEPDLMKFWKSLLNVSKYYESHFFKYYLLKHKNNIHYVEYRDDLKIMSITFDEEIYWDVLLLSNNKVTSFTKIYEELLLKYDDLQESRLIEIVSELKEKYLLYASLDLKKIIGIINTDNLA